MKREGFDIGRVKDQETYAEAGFDRTVLMYKDTVIFNHSMFLSAMTSEVLEMAYGPRNLLLKDSGNRQLSVWLFQDDANAYSLLSGSNSSGRGTTYESTVPYQLDDAKNDEVVKYKAFLKGVVDKLLTVDHPTVERAKVFLKR